jgi:hypothetical protein
MMSFMICTAHPKLFGDKIENEMGGACSMDEGEERYIQISVGKREGKRQLGRCSIDGK